MPEEKKPFDMKILFTEEGDEGAAGEEKPEGVEGEADPADEKSEGLVGDRRPAAKPKPDEDDDDEEDGDDDGDEDDRESIAELQRRFDAEKDKAVKEALEKAKEEADDDDLTDDERDHKRLKAENQKLRDELNETRRERVVEKKMHEISSCQGKYDLSDADVDLVAKYFEKNPDLEDVWSFERAARHVLPEIKDRTKTPSRNGHERPPQERGAKVIGRSGGGSPPPPPPKTTPGRGQYADVIAHMRGSGAVARLLG